MNIASFIEMLKNYQKGYLACCYWSKKEVRKEAIKWCFTLLKDPHNPLFLTIEEIRTTLKSTKSKPQLRKELLMLQKKVYDFLNKMVPLKAKNRYALIIFLKNLLVPSIPFDFEQIEDPRTFFYNSS